MIFVSMIFDYITTMRKSCSAGSMLTQYEVTKLARGNQETVGSFSVKTSTYLTSLAPKLGKEKHWYTV